MSDKLKILIEMDGSGVTVSNNFTRAWKAEKEMGNYDTISHARFSHLLIVVDALLRAMRGTRYTTMSTEEVKKENEACEEWDREWDRRCKKDWKELEARANSYANKS